ncbi:DUF2634 domain-containing protein [Anaerobacillus sp. HL2]|nr:DUF2634 domain-containing protein [Anaerobacillus sp. HL2]
MMTDGIEAMETLIFKVLNTIVFEHIIYSDDYGFKGIIGKDEVLARAELPRRIKETLLQVFERLQVRGFNNGFSR